MGGSDGAGLKYSDVTQTGLLSWQGQPGRTYFIQQSDDLLSWSYIPIIESGSGSPIQWDFASNLDKLFLRDLIGRILREQMLRIHLEELTSLINPYPVDQIKNSICLDVSKLLIVVMRHLRLDKRIPALGFATKTMGELE
ncbi:MAG: hypothetical protein AAGB06_01090, partial [Verrucomicrobiota bacterium]